MTAAAAAGFDDDETGAGTLGADIRAGVVGGVGVGLASGWLAETGTD